MNEDPQPELKSRRIDPYEDEIELMDYLLVIWKWKYIIIAGTLAFGLLAAIISFIIWKQQPKMYRTNILLKPGILKIDETGKEVFIDTPENIKALIKSDLKYKVLGDIKSSNTKNTSTALDFQVDIPQGSNIINVSLVSSLADEDTIKLNYLIKALMAEFANIIKFKQEGYEKEIDSKKEEIVDFQAEIEKIKKCFLDQIEQKKTLLAELKEKESIAKINFEKIIQVQKNIIADMLFEENKLKNEIDNYEQKLLDIESNLKILKGRIGLSSNKKDILDNLAIQNAYNNASKSYYVENENAKYNLFKLKRKILEVSKHIEDLEKANDSVHADPILQPEMYKIQKDIINVSKEIKQFEKGQNSSQKFINSPQRLLEIQINIATISKEIEKLEKEKLNIQNIQIIQPPITTEISKNNKIKRNVILSSVLGLFLMLFMSFFLEYLSNYKKRGAINNCVDG